jgi:sterol desaturase/sphingolipid hydroxylase (fatty acid hydroxylase superfamily)
VLRSWSRGLLYPAITGGATLAVSWLAGLGAPAPLLLLLEALVLAPLLLLLERLLPFDPSWLRDQGGDTRVDALHFLLSARFFDLGSALPWALALALRGPSASAAWPSAWPLPLQVALILLCSELLVYAFHRLQHENPFLWRFHRVHHSAPRMYFLNVARSHPLDALPSGLLTSLLVALWGPGEQAALLAGAFSVAHAFLQHANIDLRLGPLRRWISGPEAHRWHHSTALPEASANYGQVLLVFDRLLGTCSIPGGRAAPTRVGLAGEASLPERFLEHLRSPWRRG